MHIFEKRPGAQRPVKPVVSATDVACATYYFALAEYVALRFSIFLRSRIRFVLPPADRTFDEPDRTFQSLHFRKLALLASLLTQVCEGALLFAFMAAGLVLREAVRLHVLSPQRPGEKPSRQPSHRRDCQSLCCNKKLAA